MPRNTSIERFTDSISASVIVPMAWSSLLRRTVVILSTMIRLVVVSPFASVGWMATRRRLSVGSEVSGHTAMEFVAANLSDCRINAGRGLLV